MQAAPAGGASSDHNTEEVRGLETDMDQTSPKPSSSAAPVIIWAGFLLTPLLFGVLSWLRAADSENPAALSFSDPAVVVLCCAALVSFVLGSQVERFWSGTASPGAKDVGPVVPPSLVVRLALFEFIGLAGLVLSLVKSSFLVYLPFLFLSLAGMLISRPGERTGG